MSMEIYWFSATGNSLAAARGLEKRLPGAHSISMELAMADNRENGEPMEAARITLVFPLYFLSYPASVRKFVREFRFPKGASVSIVVTRGVKPMGGVMAECRRDLKERGLSLLSGFYLDMPNDDIILFNATDEKKALKKIEKCEARLDEIARSLEAGERRFSAEPLGFMRPIRTRVYLREISKAHEKFYLLDSCSGCGICEKTCPTGVIRRGGNGRPQWSAGCQCCEACLNFCPNRAIQYSGSKTEAKRRYHHPGIGWRDIAAQKPR